MTSLFNTFITIQGRIIYFRNKKNMRKMVVLEAANPMNDDSKHKFD